MTPSPLYIHSPVITAPHGFTTRHGGVSPAPFGSMNLGGKEDSAENIAENRKRALMGLGMPYENVAFLHQIHGKDVLNARPGIQTGDALVTKEKQLPIAVGAADCYPILFHDPTHHVIGAAHAGWRGTLAGIAEETVKAMIHLGAVVQNISVAIGPGICGMNYEVSEDVIQQFKDSGFPDDCFNGRHLDLLKCNRFVLMKAGIPEDHIWSANRCTTEDDFFSYRRDKGMTGRMWGIIMLK
ncbi:MAG: peptidoglycan editing factor PgeF [Bacteroidia bacterium]